jgi:hypothetical protein
LDPKKGFYVGRQGTNGFVCFVSRTEWEWVDFRKDHFAAMSFDAEGAKSLFPVYRDAAAMRATGKYTAVQLKDAILSKFKDGTYKAPARAGVSYMIGPMMRTYTSPVVGDNKQVVSMHMPHYMFYAPNVTDADIGGKMPPEHLFILNPGKQSHGYIIKAMGEMETAKIIAEHKDLLKRLCEFRPELCMQQTKPMQH